MATVTYAQVVKFYKNSKETTTCLNNFLKQHAQQRGGYISLWNTFREQGTSGQEDDCTFYSLLQQRKKENSLGKLQAFQGMSNEQINKFIFDDFGDIPNSKWHVFVAYPACPLPDAQTPPCVPPSGRSVYRYPSGRGDVRRCTDRRG